jgi:hypothetical protein
LLAQSCCAERLAFPRVEHTLVPGGDGNGLQALDVRLHAGLELRARKESVDVEGEEQVARPAAVCRVVGAVHFVEEAAA